MLAENIKEELIAEVMSLAYCYISEADGDRSRALELARKDCATGGKGGALLLKLLTAAINRLPA